MSRTGRHQCVTYRIGHREALSTTIMATPPNSIPNSLATARQQLEEIYFLKCSLLPGERLLFLNYCDDDDEWEVCFDKYPDGLPEVDPSTPPTNPPCVQVLAEDVRLWIEVQYPNLGSSSDLPTVNVRGDDITRNEQERWQLIIQERARDVQGSEYVLFNLIMAF